MIIFQSKAALQQYIRFKKSEGKNIAYVPTMGALHEGHISLITEAKNTGGLVVCSIYVNPTQFNDPEDLEKYPRTVVQDSALLTKGGCDVLFLPRHDEIYPEGLMNYKPVKLRAGFLMSTLEGERRPGHFEGMASIVYLLLNVVEPNFLMMGLKDYQQALIVQEMLKQKEIACELHKCPIVREDDGLALSSRNRRLSEIGRKQAPEIHRSLKAIKSEHANGNASECLGLEIQRLNSYSELKVEYLEIRGASDLSKDYQDSDELIALAAVWCGDIRLIDNQLL